VQHGFTVRLGDIQKQLEDVSLLLGTIEAQEEPANMCTPMQGQQDSELVVTASNQILQMTQGIDTAKGLLQPMQIRINTLENEAFELKKELERGLKTSSINGVRCNELQASVSQWENVSARVDAPIASSNQPTALECQELEEKLIAYVNGLDLTSEVSGSISRIYSALAGDLVDEEVEARVQERLESHLQEVRDAAAAIAAVTPDVSVSDNSNSAAKCETWTSREVGLTMSQIQSVASLLWAKESSRCRQECSEQLQDISQSFDQSVDKAVQEAKEYCAEKLKAKSKAAAASASSQAENGGAGPVTVAPPGRPDYALLGAGARVVSHLTSATYTPPSSNPLLTSVMTSLGMETGVGGPQEALSHDSTLGHCWAMEVRVCIVNILTESQGFICVCVMWCVM
jgi:hypothetical protein